MLVRDVRTVHEGGWKGGMGWWVTEARGGGEVGGPGEAVAVEGGEAVGAEGPGPEGAGAEGRGAEAASEPGALKGPDAGGRGSVGSSCPIPTAVPSTSPASTQPQPPSLPPSRLLQRHARPHRHRHCLAALHHPPYAHPSR